MRNVDPAHHVRLMYKYASALSGLVGSGEVTREALGRSALVQAGVVKHLELIGEEAWKLLDSGLDLGEGVPLIAMANMRHRMVHAYEGVDWSVVEEATFEEVPELVASLEEACARLGIELRDASDRA